MERHYYTDKVRKILLDEWDPFGVSGEPQAKDEYDVYVLRLCELLKQGGDTKDIEKFLNDVEVELMVKSDKEKNQKVAKLLINTRRADY